MEATNQTQLVPQQEVTITPATAFTNAASFELLQRIAKTFGTSAIVPAQYKMKSPQDNEALANCVIAIDMAQRMQANPIMVMQNLYIVHGNPGWSSKLDKYEKYLDHLTAEQYEREVEKNPDHIEVYWEAIGELNGLPQPSYDDEDEIEYTAEDVKRLMEINRQLNRRLFK